MQCNVPRIWENIFWDTLYKMNDCFESVGSSQRYYNRTGIFQMDYSITYHLAFSPDWSCCLTFMPRGLYAGKIFAPNLTSHNIMALLSRTSLSGIICVVNLNIQTLTNHLYVHCFNSFLLQNIYFFPKCNLHPMSGKQTGRSPVNGNCRLQLIIVKAKTRNPFLYIRSNKFIWLINHCLGSPMHWIVLLE